MSGSIYYSEEQNSFFKGKIIGKTIVEIRGACRGSDHISFRFSDNTYMKMYHSQSCCENVEVDDDFRISNKLFQDITEES